MEIARRHSTETSASEAGGHSRKPAVRRELPGRSWAAARTPHPPRASAWDSPVAGFRSATRQPVWEAPMRKSGASDPPYRLVMPQRRAHSATLRATGAAVSAIDPSVTRIAETLKSLHLSGQAAVSVWVSYPVTAGNAQEAPPDSPANPPQSRQDKASFPSGLSTECD